MRNLISLFLILNFFRPIFVQATDIQFVTELEQGALIAGITSASSLRIFNRKIDVDAEGRFVFGVGRDAPASINVFMVNAEGEEKRMSFPVRQREYKLQRIEGVEDKYVNPPEAVLQRIRNDTVLIKQARAKTTDATDYLTMWLMPAKGPISGVYGSQRIFNGVPKRPHYGLDIAGPVGTPVNAPASGVVRLAEPDMYYSGGTLIVDHGRGISSTFIHLSKILVSAGDRIEQGDLIAEIGATGRVTGPHLDWRVNWFEQRLDPQQILDKPPLECASP